MAYPGIFGRLVASGTLYGKESFAFGLSLVPPDFAVAGGLGAASHVAAAAALVRTYIESNLTSNACKLTTVKLNEIGADGRYVDKGNTTLFDFTPAASGTGSTLIAPQISLVISLVTAKKRGLASSGRFYHPVPMATIADTAGLISAATAQSHADAAATLIKGLNALWAGNTWRVGVASDVGAGHFEPVTAVRVGRVLDTMRSRRTALTETYVSNITAIP
jgi:hypothetical protein